MKDPIDQWAKQKFSKTERTILHPALGVFIASLIFFHLFSFSAIEWCEKQADYSSPLYYTSIALAITAAAAGAGALIVIKRTIERLNPQTAIREHTYMHALRTEDGGKNQSDAKH